MRRINLKEMFIMLGTAGLAMLFIGHAIISTENFRGNKIFVQTRNLLHLIIGKDNEETFKERRTHLLETCNSSSDLKVNPAFQYIKRKYLLYDSEHNFVFCMVQKIGCTFWRRVFYLLKHKNITDLYSINGYKAHDEKLPTLGHFNVTDATRVLRSATTAMFVREPYGRIFSGYLDKLHTLNLYYMKHLGRPIINMTRRNATAKSLACGHDVTFTELIQYLVEHKRKGWLIDPHFSPIHTHCLPCDVKYDFIGKMESFDEDASYIMRNTDMFQNRSITMSKNASIVDEIYSKMKYAFDARNTMSNCMTLKEMYGRVWSTLQLRGLVNPDVPMPDSRNVTLDMLLREAIKATDLLRVSEYKHKGLVNMYKTVDRRLLLQVREYVQLDCKLFGYNDRPPDLFPREQ